ncbi:MAG: 4-(cytidine 5'-diphospho)-2-C-methyl-D-erythritol kinase [Bacteroidales bacterium]|nr:4-(cytidine 5'-diphospho)-2-C-methyl-D-erythritol kinase [Bacteroidales bacterium]
MIVFSNAKINLGLRVLSKRSDGFHNIETIYYPIPIYDSIEITESETDIFTQSGFIPDVCPEQNLVMLALSLLRRKFQIPQLRIHLHKEIPIGAGLGGGSSNAAYMLKAINNKFRLNIDLAVLANLALELGSDVPFFIENLPVRALERGNVFRETELQLSNYYVLIVYPAIFISTRLAFYGLKQKKGNPEIITLNGSSFDGVNDFETSVFHKFPLLNRLKSDMYLHGARYASMSGSGSSIFGIFDKKPNLSFVKNCFYWRLIKF